MGKLGVSQRSGKMTQEVRHTFCYCSQNVPPLFVYVCLADNKLSPVVSFGQEKGAELMYAPFK